MPKRIPGTTFLDWIADATTHGPMIDAHENLKSRDKVRSKKAVYRHVSRPLRIEFPGAWYHVMKRGTNRQAIFQDSGDYQASLTRAGAPSFTNLSSTSVNPQLSLDDLTHLASL